MKTAPVDETYTITTDMKAAMGLSDCKVGDEYLLTVTKVNKDGSLDVSVENETPAEDATEATPKKSKKNPAMEKAMAV